MEHELQNVEDKPRQENTRFANGEKPQDRENPLINSSYYYIKCSVERERVQKVKVDLPNQSQNSLVKSAVNCSQTQPYPKSQRWSTQQLNVPP